MITKFSCRQLRSEDVSLPSFQQSGKARLGKVLDEEVLKELSQVQRQRDLEASDLTGRKPHPEGEVHGGRNIRSQVPEVEGLPCTRRLLCELETAARTSDIYLPRAPKEHEGRDPSEEEAPQEVDPITEIQIEAVRALYREDDPTGELSERGRRAVKVVEELTGAACETAYRLCPGRA
ncbi:uncharacterized protein LOC126982961 [Eriocheir sinensis]|uniref:uncharacterized protein LOC126982961 n=1 Tax=Eriocheir sinensis TaxID=95602 RepID=UPI0021C7CED7|nr:uncharacterized protein LOC126982961 [Eriocheir sinensis]